MSTLALLPTFKSHRSNGVAKPAMPPPVEPRLRIRLSEDKTSLHLVGGPLWNTAQPGSRRNLIDRFFTLPSVKALTLDSVRGKALLEFSEKIDSVGEVLEALAFAMRLRDPKRLPLAHEEVLLHEANQEPVKITRIGQILSFWRIKEFSPVHFRLRHPMLHLDVVREQIVQELRTLPDVVFSAPSYVLLGAIHVWCHPHRMVPHDLIKELDEAITATSEFRGVEVHLGENVLIHANLALAPISDFIFPPLGFVNALIVWSLNIDHLPKALSALRQGRTSMHLLYLIIGSLTLLTFSFFGAAVMYWFLIFWPRQVRYLRRKYEESFLTAYRRAPRRTWVEKTGSLIEVPVQELSADSVVVIKAGDVVPGDGVVLGGSARINDRLITGALEPVDKEKGDRLYATARVMTGELRMQVQAIKKNTAAEQIAQWYRHALEKSRDKQSTHAREFAEKAVLPALLVGALGLTRGGMHMAKAVIRPDYLTGPRVAENLVELAMMIRGAQEGILLPNMDCLERLVACDCIVFDDSVAWRGTGLEGFGFGDKLHEYGLPEVVLLSEGPCSAIVRHGFDTVHTGYNTVSKRAYIAQRQSFDHVVVYVGDCRTQADVAQQADFAISVLESPTVMPTGLQPAILGADLIKIVRLIALAQDSLAEFKTSYSISLVPNIVAVLAALYLHTSVNTSVVLTNVGTAVNYFRYRSLLNASPGLQ